MVIHHAAPGPLQPRAPGRSFRARALPVWPGRREQGARWHRGRHPPDHPDLRTPRRPDPRRPRLQGVGPWVTTPLRRPPGRGFTPTRQTAIRALSAAWAPVEPTAVWTSPPAAAPTAYQNRSGGLKVEPSTRRMTALRWESSPVTSLSCKNSTPQLTASALPAAVRGVTRGATRTTRARSRTVYSASPPYLARLPAATARSPSPAPTVTTAAAAAARRIRAGSTARALVPGTKGIGAYCRTSGARGGAHRTPDRRIRTSPVGSVRGQVVARLLVRAAWSRESVISPPLRSTSE
ncbi:hypothetical protein QFZ55_000814 [Streptomyces luteogriseus]|nr:hypothetical protein [Streptomyces luteogriseus]